MDELGHRPVIFPVLRWSDMTIRGVLPLLALALTLLPTAASAGQDTGGELPGPLRGPRPAESAPPGTQTTRVPDPQPMHSGWATLFKATVGDLVTLPRRPSTWVILGTAGGGALLAHQADDYVTSHIVGSDRADKVFIAGKVLGSAYTQAGVALGLYTFGRYAIAPAADGSRTNKVSHLGFDLIRAQLVAQAYVQGTKYLVRRDRPTGECCAFPSGHAASAFAAASVIERHFGYRGAWPTVVAASYVATSRLVDNRHFLSDVVVGSAVGVVSGWTVVGSHGRDQFALMPTPIRGGIFLSVSRIPAAARR
jgi:membrane-associated phospholipid phosphatase